MGTEDVVDKREGFVVRKMVRADLEHTYSWSVAEGWNIGQYDHDVFFATDPNGFFIGELEGEPIGSVSGVAYSDDFGFIGLYIVRPEFRGRGYGLQLFQAALAYLGARNIGLDGVVAQQENYKRSGFRLAYRNTRFAGTGGGAAPTGCVPLSQIPFETLAAYDAAHFPAPRPQFLRGWIREPDSVGFGLMRNGNLSGYGMIRKFVHGYCIGPLFADDPGGGDTLFRALAAQRPGEALYLDVPEVNAEAVTLAQRHGLTPIFETARMYTGPAPALPLAQVFGITSFELG